MMLGCHPAVGLLFNSKDMASCLKKKEGRMDNSRISFSLKMIPSTKPVQQCTVLRGDCPRIALSNP